MPHLLAILLGVSAVSNIILTDRLTSLASLDQQRIVNEAIDDGAGQVVPSPVTWNTARPVGTSDWSPFSIAHDFVAGARDSNGGCVKVSAHYGIVAWHVRGIATTFMSAAGVEYSRTFDTITQVGSTDLGVARWDSPLSQIPNAVVLNDCSQLSGRAVVALEMDRHANSMFAGDSSLGALTNADEDVYSYRSGPTGLVDALEGGDSGKPICLPFGGRLVVLGLLLASGSSSGGGIETQYGSGPNISHYITEINAILAGDSEELTLATLVRSPSCPNPCTNPKTNPIYNPH